MPQNVIDYSNTVFYKIYCKDQAVKDLYVGHTTNFVQRKYHHKRTCIKENDANHHCKLYKFIRENGGWDNWKMDIIGYKDCYDHYEARKVEQKYFETLKATLNSIEPLPKPKPRPTQNPKETLKHKCDVNRQQMNEMTEQKSPKISKKFICEKCAFKCCYESDFNRHRLTAKHNLLTNTNKKTRENENVYNCECGKHYKHNSSLCKHKITCSHINNNNNTIVVQENQEEKPSMMDFITQNKEIMDLLVAQNKEIIMKNKEQAILIKEQADIIRELIPKNRQ